MVTVYDVHNLVVGDSLTDREGFRWELLAFAPCFTDCREGLCRNVTTGEHRLFMVQGTARGYVVHPAVEVGRSYLYDIGSIEAIRRYQGLAHPYP